MKQLFTEEQIVKILAHYKNEEKIQDLARSTGIGVHHTIYAWKKKFSDMTASEDKRLKALESENSNPTKLVADQALDILMLKAVNTKKR